MTDSYIVDFEKREVAWPVKVQIPKDDGSGQFKERQLTLTYILLSRDELNEWRERDLEAFSDGTPMDDMARVVRLFRAKFRSSKEDMNRLLEHVTNWNAIDRKGEPVPFSRETLRQVLALDPRLFTAAYDGLMEASGEVPRKN